jgi:hypothetical protein
MPEPNCLARGPDLPADEAAHVHLAWDADSSVVTGEALTRLGGETAG